MLSFALLVFEQKHEAILKYIEKEEQEHKKKIKQARNDLKYVAKHIEMVTRVLSQNGWTAIRVHNEKQEDDFQRIMDDLKRATGGAGFWSATSTDSNFSQFNASSEGSGNNDANRQSR